MKTRYELCVTLMTLCALIGVTRCEPLSWKDTVLYDPFQCCNRIDNLCDVFGVDQGILEPLNNSILVYFTNDSKWHYRDPDFLLPFLNGSIGGNCTCDDDLITENIRNTLCLELPQGSCPNLQGEEGLPGEPGNCT